jgi:pimeloyl-ACP methyl ester carboxylesterase
VNIAYQVIGDGPLDLLFIPPFVSHLDLYWAAPETAAFFSRLASFSRLILFDKRGTGLSDPVSGVATLEERIEDVHAVLNACASQRTAIFGLSEGGPMSLLFAATYPERTTALITFGSFAKLLPAPGYLWETHESVEVLRARLALDTEPRSSPTPKHDMRMPRACAPPCNTYFANTGISKM